MAEALEKCMVCGKPIRLKRLQHEHVCSAKCFGRKLGIISRRCVGCGKTIAHLEGGSMHVRLYCQECKRIGNKGVKFCSLCGKPILNGRRYKGWTCSKECERKIKPLRIHYARVLHVDSTREIQRMKYMQQRLEKLKNKECEIKDVTDPDGLVYTAEDYKYLQKEFPKASLAEIVWACEKGKLEALYNKYGVIML